MGFFEWFRDELGFPPLQGADDDRRTWRGLARLLGLGLDNAALTARQVADEFTPQTCRAEALEGHGQERGVSRIARPARLTNAGYTFAGRLTGSNCAWFDGQTALSLDAVPPTWQDGDYTLLLGLAPELIPGRTGRLLDLSRDGRLVAQLDLEADYRPALRTLEGGRVYAPALTAGAETSLALVRAAGEHRLYLGGVLAAEAGPAPAGQADNRPPQVGRLYRGRLWALGLYARALTAAQIQAWIAGVITLPDLAGAWPLAEGSGQPWDVSGLGRHLAFEGGGNPWGKTQAGYHFNLRRGFARVGSARVPALVDGSGLAADGSTLTNPAAARHNGAETRIDTSEAYRAEVVNAKRLHDAAGRRQGYAWAIERVTDKPYRVTFFNRDCLKCGQPFDSGPVGGGDKSAFTVSVDFLDQVTADELAAVEASVNDTGRALRDEVVYSQPAEDLGWLVCGGTFAAPVNNAGA